LARSFHQSGHNGNDAVAQFPADKPGAVTTLDQRQQT
jgi:hypothetical protein